MIVIESMSRNTIIDDVTYIYFYRIIKGQVTLPIGGEKIVVQSYGIEIERQDVKDGNVVNIERDSINSISPQRHKVHNLLKLLYDNTVSPIHLIDVLGEYVDEYIIDFDKDMKEIVTN
jgi:hypothetical protein